MDGKWSCINFESNRGFNKVISDPSTGRVLGVGIVGDHAGDLISEAVMVVQSGMTVVDLAESIHLIQHYLKV